MSRLFINPLRSGSRVLIEAEVIIGIRQHRQLRTDDTEAGGILLGYRRSPHLHVVEFTTPESEDRRSRYEFEKCDPYHARHALQRWRQSGGTLDYLGEWHTHPEEEPTPSSLDRLEWRRSLRGLHNSRVFVIVGLRDEWVGVARHNQLRLATPVL